MGKRLALTIGTNYQGKEFALRGCLNDVADWNELFKTNKFSVTELAETLATRNNIITGVNDLIAGLQYGDVGAITFSGHGTWLPTTDKDEPTGCNQAICPYDMGPNGENLIIDNEFHAMFNKIVKGAVVLFLTDCCHSGTVFRFARFNNESTYASLPRFLPPSHFIDEHRAPVLFQSMERVYGPANSGRLVQAALPGLVHISACRDTEYAADAYIDGTFHGAYTYYAVREFAAQLKAGGTYQALYQQLRRKLPSRSYPQCPLLNTPPELKTMHVFASVPRLVPTAGT